MSDTEKLKAFLIKVHASTYASGLKTQSSEPSRLSSTDFRYEDRDFRYHDSYFGSRNFLGEEVVYYGSTPVWGMNYHGQLEQGTDKRVIWDFLHKCLLEGVADGECLRGPRNYTTEVFTYSCNQSGDPFSVFLGTEQIFLRTKLVYTCHFHGGEIQ